MIVRAALVLLLFTTPAQAVQISGLALNCAGAWLAPGAPITSTGCGGQGLWLDAVVTGFPVPTPPIFRFALTVDGRLLGEAVRTLPVALPPCPGCQYGPESGFGIGWRLPLDDLCREGCTGAAVASLALIGGSDPDVAFALDVPTPEPATLLLVGSALTWIGWRLRRRR